MTGRSSAGAPQQSAPEQSAPRRHDPFADRAAGWEDRFADDGPRYAWAVDLLGVAPGERVLDVGCGTGRALPALAAASGPDGRVLGLDPSPAMLAEAARLGRGAVAVLGAAVAEALPVRDGWADVVLAAGLLPHLDDPAAALRETARVLRPGGRLLVFHPISRATMAARHAGMDTDDLLIAPARLLPLLEAAGFVPHEVHDGDDRFAVLASVRDPRR